MNRIFVFLFVTILIVAVPLLNSGDKEKYGEEITVKEKTKISKILNNPEYYLDKTVLVEGEVLDVCPMAGCWIKLSSDVEGEQIKVKVKDGEIIFPMEAKGSIALVEGKLYIINLTKQEAINYYEHLAEEKGEEFDSSTISGPETIYQIRGLGVVLDKE